MSLCLKPLKGALSTDPGEMKRILKEENISYDNVEAVSEIVLVKSKPVREIRVKRTGK
jgi:sporulation protein YlmC with PRC-barrel domain